MEQNDKIVVLDVRTQEEFAAGHIPGAVLLPVDLIEAKSEEVAKVLPDKDAEILVYCRSGKRAHRAHTVHRRHWQIWVIQILNISAALWIGRMK